MRKRYSIGFLIVSLVLLVGISGAYQISYEKAKERAREEQVQIKSEIPSVSADGEAMKADCYYLMEVNGYVAVFCSDKKTAYEYTSIQVKDLPYDLQNEIKNGKYVKDTESLYSFLENYTS